MATTDKESFAEYHGLDPIEFPFIRNEEELKADLRRRIKIYQERKALGFPKIEHENFKTEKTFESLPKKSVKPPKETIVIYTDGSCLGNPGRGGWAAVFADKEISGGEKSTTNNRMELTAVIEALKATEKGSRIELFTDSNYVKNGITSWIKNWKKNGWKTSAKKPVLNKDLWRTLDELTSSRHVKFNWVKGHAGNGLNERCDQLAKSRAQSKDTEIKITKIGGENFDS